MPAGIAFFTLPRVFRLLAQPARRHGRAAGAVVVAGLGLVGSWHKPADAGGGR